MNKNTSSETKNDLTKVILKTVGKTAFYVVFLIGFLVSTLSVIAPKLMLPVFDSMGLHNASYLVYKRIYARDMTHENLYNVIQLSIEREDYEDQSYYINIMLKDDNFQKFASEIDEKTKEALGNRYNIYAYSYEDFLKKNLVVSLYKTGEFTEAKMMAIDSVYDSADELYEYINLVRNDEDLIDLEIEAEISSLYKHYDVLNRVNVLMQEAIINESIVNDDYDKVIVLQEKVKLGEIQYYLAKYGKNTELEELAKSNVEVWSSEVQELLKKL